nr:hypothetical protein [Tanacetum cinerariifolium]
MTKLTLEESLRMFVGMTAKRLNENYNLIKELRASMDFAFRNQEASIKALEIQLRQMSIILHEKLSENLRCSTEIKLRVDDEMISLADLGASVSCMPFLTYTTIGLGDLIPSELIVELADRIVKHPKRIAKNVLVGRPFLSTAHAIINVFKEKITLSVKNDKIFFKINKPTSNIIRRVYVLSLRGRMEINLESRLIGEALILDKSRDPNFGDFIELDDLHEPL